jgi:hypothetical protein
MGPHDCLVMESLCICLGTLFFTLRSLFQTTYYPLSSPLISVSDLITWVTRLFGGFSNWLIILIPSATGGIYYIYMYNQCSQPALNGLGPEIHVSLDFDFASALWSVALCGAVLNQSQVCWFSHCCGGFSPHWADTLEEGSISLVQRLWESVTW